MNGKWERKKAPQIFKVDEIQAQKRFRRTDSVRTKT